MLKACIIVAIVGLLAPRVRLRTALSIIVGLAVCEAAYLGVDHHLSIPRALGYFAILDTTGQFSFLAAGILAFA